MLRNNETPKSLFDQYKSRVFSVQNDIQFWDSFLQRSIKEYKEKFPNNERYFDSIFVVYDLSPLSNVGTITLDRRQFSINSINAEEQAREFFNWVRCISLVRIYNAVELILLQSIHLSYYPSLANPMISKTEMSNLKKTIIREISSKGISYERKNNQYLIAFVKMKSENFQSFLNTQAAVDLKTTFEKFFEFFSIIRNVISHHSLIISAHAQNQLQTVAKDVYERYFSLIEDEFKNKVLRTNADDKFLSFIILTNTFALNMVRLIFDEPDLQFLGLETIFIG